MKALHSAKLNLAFQCERPFAPANGEVLSKNNNQELFDDGEKVWFKCNQGFDLNGTKEFFCQRDGNWKPQPFPVCVRRGESCWQEIIDKVHGQQKLESSSYILDVICFALVCLITAKLNTSCNL